MLAVFLVESRLESCLEDVRLIQFGEHGRMSTNEAGKLGDQEQILVVLKQEKLFDRGFHVLVGQLSYDFECTKR